MRKLMLQMIELQKASFDNGFDAMVAIQNQTEKAVDTVMAQSPLTPSESRGAVKEWFRMLKKGREDFKKVVDDGYKHMGGYINTTYDDTFLKSFFMSS